MSNRINLNQNATADSIRWGIIGFGHVAVPHSWAILEAGHALRGFSTDNEKVRTGDARELVFNIGDLAGPFFSTHGLEIVRRSEYRQLLNDPNTDALIVCVPTTEHVNVALDVAASGKHCFLEKPMAPSHADGKRIMQAFSESKGKLVVGHVLPSFPEFEFLRTALRRAGMKNVKHLTMTRHVARSRTDDENDTLGRRGFAADLAVHDINLLLGVGTPTSVMTEAHYTRYGQKQWLRFRIGFHGSKGEFVCDVGAIGDIPFTHSYTATFADNSVLTFDGTTVTMNGEAVDIKTKTVPRIFADELMVAERFFTGRNDGSYLAKEPALRTLEVLEAATDSAKTGENITL